MFNITKHLSVKMSSGFITETEIAEARKQRQAEWEKVRQPDEPLGISTENFYFIFLIFIFIVFCFKFIKLEIPDEPYDSRSLFERLKEQKDRKDLEFEEAHKLSECFLFIYFFTHNT